MDPTSNGMEPIIHIPPLDLSEIIAHPNIDVIEYEEEEIPEFVPPLFDVADGIPIDDDDLLDPVPKYEHVPENTPDVTSRIEPIRSRPLNLFTMNLDDRKCKLNLKKQYLSLIILLKKKTILVLFCYVINV